MGGTGPRCDSGTPACCAGVLGKHRPVPLAISLTDGFALVGLRGKLRERRSLSPTPALLACAEAGTTAAAALFAAAAAPRRGLRWMAALEPALRTSGKVRPRPLPLPLTTFSITIIVPGGWFGVLKVQKVVISKGHLFSDDSALTNRPDTKTQLSLIFLRFSSCFFGFFA